MGKPVARAKTPTSAAGNEFGKPVRLKPLWPLASPAQQQGFTLIELLVVLLLVAIGSSLVVLTVRDTPQDQLRQEADRLIAVLETAKAQARGRSTPLRWQADDKGFSISPLLGGTEQRMAWLHLGTRAEPNTWVISAEPVQAPVQLQLRQASRSEGQFQTLTLSSDGAAAFKVQP
jgi:general secretion pathway protein H